MKDLRKLPVNERISDNAAAKRCVDSMIRHIEKTDSPVAVYDLRYSIELLLREREQSFLIGYMRYLLAVEGSTFLGDNVNMSLLSDIFSIEDIMILTQLNLVAQEMYASGEK